MDETQKEVPEHLVSKKDGRKRAWWVKKIAVLEAELASLRNGTGADISSDSWAEGFVACLNQFQIMNKSARKRILVQLKMNGPKYARRIKGAKFRGFTL